MGLFRRLGRRVGEFEEEAKSAAEEEADYECSACGERFYTESDRCPECGSGDVVALDDE
ncbi:MAG: hypothetical protein ABEJ04_06555 [Halobacteriaceae archaeon]